MEKKKIISTAEAVALIKDGDTLACGGFGTNGVPDALLEALEMRFLDSAEPRELTLLFGGGPGDGGKKGLNRIAKKGLLKRVIGGHYGLVPEIADLATSGDVEAYNLPLGCISHLFRDIAAGKPGTLSKVGIGTFVDPRLEGGKINSNTQEDLVSVEELAGEEFLFYRALPVSVAFIRGTTGDSNGNISIERETLSQDTLAIAMATKNSGGLVIAQVERIAETGSLGTRNVKLPGIFVDAIVVSKPEGHMQTFGTQYDAAFAGRLKKSLDSLPTLDMSSRKVIARRAAMELQSNSVVNLGIGIPEGVAAIAAEERIQSFLTLTTEPGVIGGIPAKDLDFGAAVNADAIIDMNHQFDFYDGGGLDLACLGLAQCDQHGNINVSRFGPKLAGAGGFINIAQNAKKVVYVGTFTAGGLKISIEDQKIKILQEGKIRKFVEKVEQVTFSAKQAIETNQSVYYVTERCVFKLTKEGLVLCEVAPGIDIERDIFAHMDFKPLVDGPLQMDTRIFTDELMGLKKDLFPTQISDRVSYLSDSNTLFLNFEAMKIQNVEDVEAIRSAVINVCSSAEESVNAVVNYDDIRISEDIFDLYTKMAEEVSDEWYRSVVRYSSNAFISKKLGDALGSRNGATF